MLKNKWGLGYEKTSDGSYNPSQKEIEVRRLVEMKFKVTERDTHKYPFERTWFESAAFYEGYQHLLWNDVTGTLEPKPTPSWRKRFTCNWIFPTVQRATSMVYANQPRVAVAPASAEKADRDRALMAEKFWLSYTEKTAQKEKDREALTLAAVCGNSFFKVTWDATLGRSVEGTNGKPLYEGDVKIEVVSPWQIFIDPFAKSIEESQWLVQCTVKPLDTIAAQYPKKGKYVKADKGAGVSNWFEKRLLGMSGRTGYSGLGDGKQNEECATVTEFWSRPSPEHPKGLHVIIGGGYVVLNDSFENPYVGLDEMRDLEIPFFKVGWAKAVNRFWDIGLVEQLIPIQREINTTKAQIIENRNVASRPGWIIPKGSGISRIPDAPDKQVVYNPQFPPPQPIQPPDMPQYVFQFQEDLVRDFQVVSAQSDATQARAPASVRTGVAIELLQEKDESVYGPIRHSFWETKSRVARAALTLVQKYYREPRLIKVAGTNYSWEVTQFMGADISGATDIRFLMDSGLGQSRSARAAIINDLVQLGVMDMSDPIERRKVANLLEITNLDEIFHDITLDEREAEQEVGVMSAQLGDMDIPAAVPVMPWQNHEVHFRIHNNFRKTQQYRELPDDLRVLFDMHADEHALYIQQNMMEEQAQMEAAKGSPGEKGVASQPSNPVGGSQLTAAKQEGGMNGSA